MTGKITSHREKPEVIATEPKPDCRGKMTSRSLVSCGARFSAVVPPCYEANSVSSSSSIGAEFRCIFTPALAAAFFNFRHRRSVNAIALEPDFHDPPIISFTRSSESYGEDGC